MFIDHGRIVLDCSMEDFESRYAEVMVRPDSTAAARSMNPLHERQVFGRSVMLFDRANREALAALGELRSISRRLRSLVVLLSALVHTLRSPSIFRIRCSRCSIRCASCRSLVRGSGCSWPSA